MNDTGSSRLLRLLVLSLFMLGAWATCHDGDPGPSSSTARLRAASLAAIQADAPPAYRALQAEGGAYLAANPLRGFRTRFGARGVEVTPSHAAAGRSWRWGLRLSRYGTKGSLKPVADAKRSASNNRVEYARGALTEWYVNGPAGLEQGFTLHERPGAGPGDRRARDIVLEMETEGNLAAALSEDGSFIALNRAGGEAALTYRDLYVEDARGRELGARLSVRGARISISVDAAGAEFPLAIDPLIATETKVMASDGAGLDDFGASASVSGNTAVIGAYGDSDKGKSSGSAYVFVRKGTKWSQQAKLLASAGAKEDYFGYSSSVSGDTAVVGAPWNDDNGEKSGSAYVYVRSGSNWSQQAKLVPADNGKGDCFGWATSISGDTIVVGAYRDDDKASDAGAAYVFVRSGTKWSQQAKLLASDGVFYDCFGFSVAIDGNTVAVGAEGVYHNGQDAGAAYVFVRSGTKWSQQAKFLASDGAKWDDFGYSISISGDSILVGSWDNLDLGAAYVFVRSGTKWSEQAKFLASDGAKGDQFGISVALHKDMALVGSYGDDDKGWQSGSAYVFVRSGTKWTEQLKLLASDGVDQDRFGRSVSLGSGRRALVGAYYAKGKDWSSGAAYFYELKEGLYPDGTVCKSKSDCKSGFCVDGVCCDSACGGGKKTDCQSCAKAGGASKDGVCTVLPKTAICRKAAGPCDAEETCDGKTAACPKDLLMPTTLVCRKAAGPCDAEETCDGKTTACPKDLVKSASTECRKAAGVCDAPETCDGKTMACPNDAVKPATEVCRKAAGDCDAEEKCDGKAAACPKDLFKPTTLVCRKAAGDCDAEETCDGKAADCPKDLFKPTTLVCRKAAGDCDAEETCDGKAADCPKDAFKPATAVCRKAAGDCDAEEKCPGTGVKCPTDTKAAEGTSCKGGTCRTGICVPADSGVPPADAGAASAGGGCDCRVASRGSAGSGWILMALGLLLLRRRRCG